MNITSAILTCALALSLHLNSLLGQVGGPAPIQYPDIPQGHYNALSKHWPNPNPSWPPNHEESFSRTWPKPTGRPIPAVFPLWPANHHNTFSEQQNPPEHLKTVSKNWDVHPNHYATVSKSWPNNHVGSLSHLWPSNHYGPLSENGVPPTSHHKYVSRYGSGDPPNHWESVSKSWPNNHLQDRSVMYPPNHFDAISRFTPNPPHHNKTQSFFYPPGHMHVVSKYRPPGGVDWPAGHSTPSSNLDGEVPEEPWPPWPDGHDYTTTIKTWVDIAGNVSKLIPAVKGK